MRRKRCTKSFVLFLLLARLSPSSLELSNVSLSRSSRAIDGQYKYLIFPQGSNVQTFASGYIMVGNEEFASVWKVSLNYSHEMIDSLGTGRSPELIYCLTIGTFAKPENFFTMGVTAGLAYELPYKRTVPYRKPAEVYHRRSRRDLYHKLEIMLKTQGKDGRACILGALCQAGKRNWASTADRRPFLDEILHSIFTFPAYTGGEAEDGDGEESHEQKLKSTEYDRAYSAQDDCDKYFASCPSLF